jgi:hypothetical protein
MLTPTLSSAVELKPGTIHISINHACYSGSQEEQKRHSVFLNTPAADVRPPEGVPSAALHCVRFCMDLAEAKQAFRPTLKRSKTSLTDINTVRSATDRVTHDRLGRSYVCLVEAPSGGDIPLKETQDSVPYAELQTGKRKRKPTTDNVDQVFSNATGIGIMVDGALRLAVCGGLNKSVNGLKIKANTFLLGLSSIAPIFFRVGYLTVRICLQMSCVY